jgi:hypothetical protein
MSETVRVTFDKVLAGDTIVLGEGSVKVWGRTQGGPGDYNTVIYEDQEGAKRYLYFPPHDSLDILVRTPEQALAMAGYKNPGDILRVLDAMGYKVTYER